MKRLFIDGLNAFQSASVEPVRLRQYLTALVNELRVLGVTTVFTLVVPDLSAPFIRGPTDGEILNLADNLILLRYVEVRSRLHRLISLFKVRDSAFDSAAHQYVTSGEGLRIEDTSDSAETILARAQQPEHAAIRREPKPSARRGG